MNYILKASITSIITIVLLSIGIIFGFIDQIRNLLSFPIKLIVFLDFGVGFGLVYYLSLKYFENKEKNTPNPKKRNKLGYDPDRDYNLNQTRGDSCNSIMGMMFGHKYRFHFSSKNKTITFNTLICSRCGDIKK